MHRAIFTSSLTEVALINNKKIRVIYFGEWLGVDPDTGATVTSYDPKLAIKLSEVSDADLVISNDVIVRGKKYCISEIRKDGEGAADLILKKTT